METPEQHKDTVETAGTTKVVSTVKTEGEATYRLMRHMCIISRNKQGETSYSDYLIEGTVEEVEVICRVWATACGREVLFTKFLNCVSELRLT